MVNAYLPTMWKVSVNKQQARDSKGHNETHGMNQEVDKHVPRWIVTNVWNPKCIQILQMITNKVTNKVRKRRKGYTTWEEAVG